jgi:hypothetical protein
MTNREKYEAFRKLYTGSDPHREDHQRFDKLVRLLLDLPETDEPPFKVGDFVAFTNAVGLDHEVFRVVGVEVGGREFDVPGRVTIRDRNGRDYSRLWAEVRLVPAFNEPVTEMPF